MAHLGTFKYKRTSCPCNPSEVRSPMAVGKKEMTQYQRGSRLILGFNTTESQYSSVTLLIVRLWPYTKSQNTFVIFSVAQHCKQNWLYIYKTGSHLIITQGI